MDTVTTWFEKTLPSLLAARFDDFLAVSGAIAFDVAGDGWTLTFADPTSPVRHELDEDAELELRFSAAAFEAFTHGTLDTPTAIASGAVSSVGDLQLLSVLASLMLPAQHSLGWDARRHFSRRTVVQPCRPHESTHVSYCKSRCERSAVNGCQSHRRCRWG